MDDYANLTKCNVLHSFRLCSKESFFSRNYSFSVDRDCTTPGLLFNVTASVIICIMTVVGNLLVPAVLWRQRHTQWGPYGLCKLWLCGCDIIICAVYLPVRVVMIVQVLYGSRSYDTSFVVQVAKELAETYNRELSVPGAELRELQNYTYYMWPNNGSGPYNLQMLFKMYETYNRNSVIAMSCFLATYILLCTWILAVMSVDRYLAIVFPFKYQRWISVRRTKFALTFSTFISLLVGTVWPITHIKLYFPSINNRFGFGAIFLLGRNRLEDSREILFFYALWLLPLLAVIVCNILTAFFCLFLLPRKNGCIRPCCFSVCVGANRKHSIASEISVLRYNPPVLAACCGGSEKVQDDPTSGEVPVASKERRSTEQRMADDTLEAFWTLALMTAVFLVIMGPSFVMTVFVPVPCEDATKWTWIYIGVQFLFMNQPSHHIIVYNFRSGNFRREVKAILKKLAAKLTERCRA